MYKEIKYPYSIDIIDKTTNQVIGMINKEDKTWYAYVNNFGNVTDNGFHFTTKKSAKEKVIKTHEENK